MYLNFTKGLLSLQITIIIMQLSSPYPDESELLLLRKFIPVDNIPASIDYSLVVLLGGFMEPLLINSNIYYSEGHKYSHIFIAPIICIILLTYFIMNFMATLLLLRKDNGTFVYDKEVTYSYVFLMLERNNHGLIQFLILGLLGACLLTTHNQILIDTTYLLGTNTIRLATYRHISKGNQLLLHQVGSVVITIIAIFICHGYYPYFWCLLITGLDINYTFVFPQMLASFGSTNFMGAIASLFISIILRSISLDMIACNEVERLPKSTFNAVKCLLPAHSLDVLPVRTIIVIISIIVNVFVSIFGKWLVAKLWSPTLIDNMRTDFYLTDDQFTCDNSSASVRIKWDLTTVQSIERTESFNLNAIPKAEIYYKVIPDDLACKMGSYAKKATFSHAHKIFKIPLQNRMCRKELTVAERRERLMLNKAMMEWTYYCYMKGIHYIEPELSEELESATTISFQDSFLSPTSFPVASDIEYKPEYPQNINFVNEN